MRLNSLKAILKTAVRGVSVLLLGAGMASAQSVNLTAGSSTLILPDGNSVPMWGYTCTAAVTATCANLSTGAWSPVLITVPAAESGSTSLTINLTNSLPVPTSITVVGQLGGGLGLAATSDPSPDHSNAQGATTWPIPGGPGALAPSQGPRVRSFSTEVGPGATVALPAWATLRPGTYLIESGTHPSIQGPMGLYGILVVTTAPASGAAGTAYPATTVPVAPAVTYNADVSLLFSEIDPVQNMAVAKAVALPGFSESTVWSGLPGGCGNPGTANFGNCYPPAVNYSPLYYLINGVAFDKTHSPYSLFSATPATSVTGTVLVRMVNAGLRMHVPSIVG